MFLYPKPLAEMRSIRYMKREDDMKKTMNNIAHKFHKKKKANYKLSSKIVHVDGYGFIY